GNGGLERGRGDGQVEQPPRAAAELPFRLRDRLGRPTGRAQLRAGEGGPAGDRLPGRPARRASPEFAGRLARQLAELVVGQCPAGGADDLVPVRHQPRRGQVEQPGQQLAPGQITRCPEHDDDVVAGPRRQPAGPAGPGRRRPHLGPLPGTRRALTARVAAAMVAVDMAAGTSVLGLVRLCRSWLPETGASTNTILCAAAAPASLAVQRSPTVAASRARLAAIGARARYRYAVHGAKS